MKLPLSWLKDYIDLEGIREEVLAEELNTKVMEIEHIYNLSSQYSRLDKIKVGEIKKIYTLDGGYKILLVDIGKDNLKLVVNREVNINESDKVAVATVGITLYSNIKVESKEIEGVISEGVICSELDLGIGDIKDKPFYLHPDTKIGISIKQALELDDIIFEFNVEPNRIDLLSIYGIARELHTIFNIPTKPPKFIKLKELNIPQIKVEVDKEVCRRYCILVIEDIKVSQSPIWLQNRLRKLGARPINNIVDLTNYVMFELGQPLHAFDLDKIEDKLVVRRGREKEILFTLDGKKRILNENMVVIADAKGAIALGGIMGGEDTAISGHTKRIVVESANFEPTLIRKASRMLGLRTESSLRFEKNLTQMLAPLGLSRFAYLVGGKVVSFIDKELIPQESKKIRLELNNLNSLLGSDLSMKEITCILERLEFGCKSLNSESIEVTPPYFRQDINIEEDLIEEIGRIYGYNKIHYTLPSVNISPPLKNWGLFWDNLAKDVLVNCGMTEIQTTSLYGDEEIKLFDIKKELHLELDNPLSQERKYMRLSLVPQLISMLKLNLKWYVGKYKKSPLFFFELGRIYIPNEITQEKKVLVGGVTSGIKLKNKDTDFFLLKRIVEILIERLGIKNYNFIPLLSLKVAHVLYDINKVFHPYRTALVAIKTEILGIIGEIHPHLLKELDLNCRVAIFDIDFETLSKLATQDRKYKEYSPFPPIKEDYSFVVKKDVLVGDIIRSLYDAGEDLVTSVNLIDLYEGEGIKETEKSLTFSVVFQSHSSTLTKDKIKNIREKMINSVITKFDAKLRGEI